MSGYWIAGIVAWVAMWRLGYAWHRQHLRSLNKWTVGQRYTAMTLGVAIAPFYLMVQAMIHFDTAKNMNKPARW